MGENHHHHDHVILHGMWMSAYAKKVELALKIKGIPFEYVEEDLRNKSPQLLQQNPIHKKVPMLLHNGRPIVESIVIVEYIDETWKNLPRILPENAYQRARVRFWAKYIHQLSDTMKKAFISARGQNKNAAFSEFFVNLEILEKETRVLNPMERPKISAQSLGILDIALVATLGMHKAVEEVLGMKIIDQEKHPFIFSWVESLLELPLVKETLPPHEKVVSRLELIKQHGFNAGIQPT
nr:glutathione S-transferase U10-like [Ipomoea batatas]